jgi:Putative Flp pilus-assembly TadE/G-like
MVSLLGLARDQVLAQGAAREAAREATVGGDLTRALAAARAALPPGRAARVAVAPEGATRVRASVELPVGLPFGVPPVAVKATAVAAREPAPTGPGRPVSAPTVRPTQPRRAVSAPASFLERLTAAEDGGATLVALALAGVILMAGVAAVEVGALVSARAAVQTAADMAALAAITPVDPFALDRQGEAERTEGRATSRAAEIAAANGSELVLCECSAVQGLGPCQAGGATGPRRPRRDAHRQGASGAGSASDDESPYPSACRPAKSSGCGSGEPSPWRR